MTDSDKKGADRGVDGRILFHDDPAHLARTKQVVLQVKGGRVGAKDVRDLRGVLEREADRGAVIAALISLKPPTAAMRAEAASAGMYEKPAPSPSAHPRVQLLTVEGLLTGADRLDLPLGIDPRTVKKAPRARQKSDTTQPELL